MGLYDYTVYDFICRNAQSYPDRDCIVFKGIRLSYSQYKKQCDRLAAGLTQLGVSKGDRLAVIAQNSDEFMVLYGSAAKIGSIIVPVNWRFKQKEVTYVLNDCSPVLIFAGPDFREIAATAANKVKSVKALYAMGGGEIPEGFLPLETLYLEDEDKVVFDVPAESGFVIIHTAAVEGEPRGALLSQSNIIHSNLQLRLSHNLETKDAFICILPLFHIWGLSLAMAVMHAGGKIVIMERFDPVQALKTIGEEKITNLAYFPPILQMLTEKYEETGGAFDLSILRVVGGLDSPENILRFKEIAINARFWTGYGQTEAFPVTGGFIEDKPGSAGQPFPLAKVAIFDDYDNEVSLGTPGEICVRSPVVFLGYWGRDNDNAYTFRNGWHHTGDLGRFDEESFLWYVGRKEEKELIKPGGENVYPAEVEEVILEHEDILEASVIGVPDEQWGEAIKAVCVLEPGRSLKPESLIDFVASKIARYKKPKYVTFVDALPKNEQGVVDYNLVKKEHGG